MEDFDAFEAMAEFQAFQAEGGYADPEPEPDYDYWNPVEQGYYDDDPSPYDGNYSEM